MKTQFHPKEFQGMMYNPDKVPEETDILKLMIFLYICGRVVRIDPLMKEETRTPFPTTFCSGLQKTGKMKEIKLTKGFTTQVDDWNYDWLNKWKWQVAESGNTLRAKTTIIKNGKKTSVYMHRLILNAKKGDEIDHRDTYGLNNQEFNLRFTSRSGNRANTVKKTGCYSTYKGVAWNRRANKWIAQLTHNYKHINLGYFKTEIEAACAYDAKAKELFGEFANLNFKG